MFKHAVADHDWVLCRNEGTIEDAKRQVVDEIYKVLGYLSKWKQALLLRLVA
ncbi:hypothetical protein PS684_03395 [Pseudomonas fluorescens]|nr:hypothetical protein PS681_00720 [Pseudomonas fluorescens]VVN59072.1 hypothetical protein PS684_03395 [Pseudomonas fluorescens]